MATHLRKVYDQEQDVDAITVTVPAALDDDRAFTGDAQLPFLEGMPVHLARLAAATRHLLMFSDPATAQWRVARSLAADVLANYDDWQQLHGLGGGS